MHVRGATPLSAGEIERELQELNATWWHQIDLGHGIVTPGRGGSTRTRLARLHLPDDLSGRTVLDIGAADGFFTFEAERRGAARVVALTEWENPTFDLARRALGSRAERVTGDLMQLTARELDGPFDVVIFSGVLYHLPDPLGGLRRVYELTAPVGLMLLETDTRYNYLPTPTAELVHDTRPVSIYTRNWWRPNRAALISMCEQVGFTRVQVVAEPASDAPPPFTDRVLRRVFGRGREARDTLRCSLHAWR